MSKAKTSFRDAPPVGIEEAGNIVAYLDQVIATYKGDIGDLEAAIGMYMVGRLMGWKVLVLIHNKRTIRKYEETLGINIREEFPAETDLSDKSIAYILVQKLGSFWKAVSGELKDDELREKRRELAL